MPANTPNKTWHSTPFTHSWISKILDLRFKIFHEDKYTQTRWEWQYINNPQGKAHLSLAVDNETSEILAGHYAMMAYQVKLGNEHLRMAQSVDTFTNPNFRNQGIFIDLAKITYDEAKKDNVFGVFGFPNASSYPGFVKKLGFNDPFGLKFWVKPLSLGIIIKKLNFPRLLGWKWGQIPLFITPKRIINNFFEVEKLPQDWEKLIKKFERIVPICVARTNEYMSWRFFNCPDRSYKYFEFRQDGDLLGFVVLAITNDQYPTGQIVDFIFSSTDHCEEMITFCMWKLKSLGAYTAVSYLHHENIISRYFSQLGFRARGSETRFILKNLNSIPNYDNFVLTPANWYLTGGDTDYL